MGDITQLLAAVERGEPQAAEELLPRVYDELRKVAAARLAHEKPGQTLQATALVHEAFLRLAGPEHAATWQSRAHFFGAAAEAMRRILVENARRKQAARRGGEFVRCEAELEQIAAPQPDEKLLALDEALTRLAGQDARKAQLVKLRFFAGLTTAEAAQMLGISTATADRDWAFARAWLQREMAASE
jgi:RNA polymerase sigma factor (TIGR02999 family)